jgi:hypothetical protein
VRQWIAPEDQARDLEQEEASQRYADALQNWFRTFKHAATPP